MSGNLFENSGAPGTGEAGDWLTAHCDGGSRGNPGPSGYGAVIEDGKGRTVAELSEFLGIQTNNYAEYSGLLAVLKWAIDNGARRLRVVSDSELMVKQMQGKYAVKSPVLKPLFEEARKLSRRVEGFEMRHTLRGGNKVADRLANEAMDRGMGKTASQRVSGSASQPVSTPAGSATGQTAPNRSATPAAARPERLVLEGYVKDGVVHLLGGELPDGVFVKIVRE
jgi:probable phosphoglycerate mutase